MSYLKNEDMFTLTMVNAMLLSHFSELNDEEKKLQDEFQKLVESCVLDKQKKKEYTKLQLREYRKDPNKLEKLRKSSRESIARKRAKEKIVDKK